MKKDFLKYLNACLLKVDKVLKAQRPDSTLS